MKAMQSGNLVGCVWYKHFLANYVEQNCTGSENPQCTDALQKYQSKMLSVVEQTM